MKKRVRIRKKWGKKEIVKLRGIIKKNEKETEEKF